MREKKLCKNISDHAHFFDISSEGNHISVFLQSTIPRELIYEEKVLTLNIIAEKPFTVGANAAIAINFPSGMYCIVARCFFCDFDKCLIYRKMVVSDFTEPEAILFFKRTYIGQFENNVLTVEKLEVVEGFHPDIEFFLNGGKEKTLI